jgi:hypothetical protein
MGVTSTSKVIIVFDKSQLWGYFLFTIDNKLMLYF